MKDKATGIIIWILGTFFGVGYSPAAPGTAASLSAVVLYWLFFHQFPPLIYLLFLAVIFTAGVWSSGRLARQMGKTDPGLIVIDEICGQLVVLFLVYPSFLNLGLSFALFRFFDIIKPFPIRNAEKFPGGWGIMADDIAAGIIAAVIVHFVLVFV